MLSIFLSLFIGENAMYNISWGDDTYEIIDHTGKITPEDFSASHQYTTAGTYTATVRVWNSDTSIELDPFKIEVQLCTFPLVDFVYGSASAPLIFAIGDAIELISRWKFTSPQCKEDQIAFKLDTWSLINLADNLTVVDTLFADKSYDAVVQKAVYKVPKSQLAANSYRLTLEMSLANEVKEYFAYFDIVESPLVADIKNGFFQSVSYKIPKNDVGRTFLNFTLDATNSHDPDYTEAGTNGITFTWECKVVDPVLKVDQSIASRLEVNKTLYEHTTCLNRDWVSAAPHTGPLVHYNTEMFLENITYSIRLTITKGARVMDVTQTLFISAGDVPVVGLT